MYLIAHKTSSILKTAALKYFNNNTHLMPVEFTQISFTNIV
jgi:hypothetical protein